MFSQFDELKIQNETEGNFPSELPILPLRGAVAFPFIILPLSIGVPRSVNLIRSAIKEDSLIGLVVSQKPELEEPEPEDLHPVGVLARIHRVVRGEKEALQIIVQGIERFKIESWTQTEPFLKAKIVMAPDIVEEDQTMEIEALKRRMLELSQAIVEYLPQVPNEVSQFLEQMHNPRSIVYTIASNMRMEFEDRLQILLEDSLRGKMNHLVRLMTRELEVLQIGQQIRSETQEELDKNQREYYLRQQLKAIQKELGEDDEQALAVEYREKIETAGLPEEAKKEALRELSR
ncbi:MAG: LON peptidase substrate-binding domain-containing protein, partial [Anaerolineae bacterium]